jgi:hypothetical protein
MPGNLFHRSFRHNVNGVEEVRKKWGDEAAKAAEIHIKRDFPGLDRIPTGEDWKNPEQMYKLSDQYFEIDKEIPNEQEEECNKVERSGQDSNS